MASVSSGLLEWALVWVSLSGCLKRWLWQSASESQLASQLPWQLQLPSELRSVVAVAPSELRLPSQLVSHLAVAVAVAVAVGVNAELL